jgi:hypothetical protein
MIEIQNVDAGKKFGLERVFALAPVMEKARNNHSYKIF